jgi:hypothetical protein
MRHIGFAAMLLFALSAKATDHTVRLEINNGGDTLGWHFSRYDGPKSWGAIGIPLGSNFTKLYSLDDSSRRMFRGETFDRTFTVPGPGIYILDFSDWSNDCNVQAKVTVDNEVRFSTSSYAIPPGIDRSKLQNWHSTVGRDVKQTDDREIAMILD